MTRYYLLPYNCSRCNSLRRTWFEVIDDHDKEIINQYYESDNMMLTLNQLVEIELLCPRCMAHTDLTSFGLHV